MSSGANAAKNLGNSLRSRLTLAYELSELLRPSLNRHKGKLIDLLKEKAEKTAQSGIARRMRVAKGYYTLEMAPPRVDEMSKLSSDLKLIKEFVKSGCFKHLTVKQAWLLILVATEVGLWFFLGETIGKMHIIGYQV